VERFEGRFGEELEFEFVGALPLLDLERLEFDLSPLLLHLLGLTLCLLVPI